MLEGQTDEARSYMTSIEIVRKDLEERLDRSVLVGAWIEGRLAGIVNYVDGPRDPYAEFSGEDEAGVRGLAVGIDWQRRGVGRSLVVYCIERASAEAKSRLVLHTTPWMHTAQRLYPRLGFRRAPEIDFSPAPGVPLIGFTLDLGA
ncbi:MAG: GNAT family N-acetyltransferase [Actinomycetota bacterium]